MKYCCLLIVAFLFAGCNKDVAYTKINCESLRNGLLTRDAALVSKSLGNLLNMKYTLENFNALTDSIANSCDMTAEYACFNCVQTLPPESEIGVAFLDDNGDSTIRVIDLAAAADSSIKLLYIEQ